ncbi:hypothetical protein ICN19_04100 [Polynucleobacter sp. AP-Capit-er-40B-B4]|uniref:hypothetical protein n=1 Tax=Polynucleobacter sp. AP-Capit-er-40B-B4 TaxID=2576927 RepID=UPI001C0CF07C|nr:hypothetical protein [Polynucleobacter sp. AP-Capit-er-40B-B4]MBU3581199.1 hypothetical protein [Polynucleobacter sp. AP-Capit-er-40B-B4]
MNNILQKISIVFSIVVLWILCDYLNIYLLKLFQIHDFLYAIYLLAGFRLLAVILFGWVGVLGIFLGYLLSGYFLRGFDIQDAICLGGLSSIAPYIAYQIWKIILKKTNDFLNVNFIDLFYLIMLSSTISAVFRSSYLIGIDKNVDSSILLATFAANVSGSIIFLFGLKALFNLLRRLFLK